MQVNGQCAATIVRGVVRYTCEAPHAPFSTKQHTRTNPYNERPTWLDLAHHKLDAAVLDAYSWPHELQDEEILTRLLALNGERAAGQQDTSTAIAVVTAGLDEA